MGGQLVKQLVTGREKPTVWLLTPRYRTAFYEKAGFQAAPPWQVPRYALPLLSLPLSRCAGADAQHGIACCSNKRLRQRQRCNKRCISYNTVMRTSCLLVSGHLMMHSRCIEILRCDACVCKLLEVPRHQAAAFVIVLAAL